MRLIDADRLINDIDCSADLGGELGKVVEVVKLYAKFMAQSALTIEERKTGRWERKMDGVYCSACHKGWDFIMGVPADVETKYRYCPNCGGKMEVEHE